MYFQLHQGSKLFVAYHV